MVVELDLENEQIKKQDELAKALVEQSIKEKQSCLTCK